MTILGPTLGFAAWTRHVGRNPFAVHLGLRKSHNAVEMYRMENSPILIRQTDERRGLASPKTAHLEPMDAKHGRQRSQQWRLKTLSC
jgi:hypothetical protein